MNIRKNIDYTEMYEALDELMSQQLSQMKLYWEIGKAVCRRTEKGAAVMASEYLNKQYPDVKGFSPRSLRRIRDFYRTYENYPALLSRAMKLGWTQNVVIMEADLTMELREWYLKATVQFEWSKMELSRNITDGVHQYLVLLMEEMHNEVMQKGDWYVSIRTVSKFYRNITYKLMHRFIQQLLNWIFSDQKWWAILWRDSIKALTLMEYSFELCERI